MELIVRYSCKLFAAVIEVLLVYYFADAFFERRLQKSCYLIGISMTVFLFSIDSFFSSLELVVGGFLTAIVIIVFSSYGGFKEFLPKLLISIFIYWILSLGETIPAMLCMELFGETSYISAIQNNLLLYAVAYFSGKLLACLLTYLVKRSSKKRIVSFKLKYKIFLLICPTISFVIYFYWCNLIYYGIQNDYLFTLGLSISLFIINLMNIKLLNWICEEAEENTKILMVQEYLKNERKHIFKLNERNREIRKMGHDIRHHMLTIYSLLCSGKHEEAQNYAKHFADGAEMQRKTIDTGNSLIDSVINEYKAQAEQNGIEMDLTVNLFENLPVDEIGIVIILGNAFINAIEYCLKEKIKLIKVAVQNNDKFLMIEIINRLTSVTPEMKAGIYKTSKPDSSAHGIGIQSMKETVKSLGGDLSIKCVDGNFTLSAAIPIKQVI